MRVKELIEKLQGFNLDAETNVIVHNHSEKYTITWGGSGEGETRSNCLEVSFYVDNLCQGEQEKG